MLTVHTQADMRLFQLRLTFLSDFFHFSCARRSSLDHFISILRQNLTAAALTRQVRKHEWWGDSLSFLYVPHRHLQGSTQITDAWLAELARRRKGRLATLDSGLAALHSDVAVLLPL